MPLGLNRPGLMSWDRGLGSLAHEGEGRLGMNGKQDMQATRLRRGVRWQRCGEQVGIGGTAFVRVVDGLWTQDAVWYVKAAALSRGVDALRSNVAVLPAKSGVALRLAAALIRFAHPSGSLRLSICLRRSSTRCAPVPRRSALAGVLGLSICLRRSSTRCAAVPRRFALAFVHFFLDESQFLSSICVLTIYPCATSSFLPSFLPSLFMYRGTLVIRRMGRLSMRGRGRRRC